MIDTHCHLADKRFDKDREEAIERAHGAGVRAFVEIAYAPEIVPHAHAIAARHPDLFLCVGVHPSDAGRVPESYLDALRDHARHARVVAIGETGLDFYRDRAPRDAQERWFRTQLALADEMGLPVVIHQRAALEETLAILESRPPQAGGVLHCFDDGPDAAARARAIGFKLGIGGCVTYGHAALEDAVRSAPAEMLVLETDAPYLEPEPRSLRRNEPALLARVVARLSALRGWSAEETVRVTTANARALFRLALALACVSAGPAAVGAAAAPSPAPLGIAFETRVTDLNRVALTLSNYGTFGNNFFSRAPSLEFPRLSGFEHMYLGGLWVGAQAVDGGGPFTGATTGALDAGQGPTTPDLTEFTPSGALLVRSSDPLDPFYSPDAISHQDVVATYDDLTPRQAAANPEPHRPLGIAVRQESYAWRYDILRDVVFLHFVIRNTGAPLSNVWVGMYTGFASGNKAGYVSWPPSIADPGGLGSWYRKAWLVYEGSLRMLREHYCAAQPIPAGCQTHLVPPWAGLQLLTPPAAGQGVTLAAWRWSPANVLRDQDVERHAIMSAGSINPLTGDSLLPQTGDPVELLALGPFASIATGDSIEVDFAFIGGDDDAAILANGIVAQQVFDAGYDVTTSAQVSLAGVSAAAGRVTLRWYAADLAGQELRVERSEAGRGWEALGVAAAGAGGTLEFVDRTARAGTRYGYRLVWSEGGQLRSGGEAWIDVPATAAFRVHGARPNPAAGDGLHAAFSLPTGGDVRLRLLDVGGRAVVEHWAHGLGPGEHLVRLDSRRIAPGVYVLEMSHEGRTATARVAVVR